MVCPDSVIQWLIVSIGTAPIGSLYPLDSVPVGIVTNVPLRTRRVLIYDFMNLTEKQKTQNHVSDTKGIFVTPNHPMDIFNHCRTETLRCSVAIILVKTISCVTKKHIAEVHVQLNVFQSL
jgi:hypothetical protein